MFYAFICTVAYCKLKPTEMLLLLTVFRIKDMFKSI